nr:Rha family transcriptional regulator [Ignatzschineria indica]
MDSYGREMPKYTMDKDSFLMLAMGYHGAKATEIRYRYIQAFNAMCDRLKLQKTIDEELAEAIKLDEISFMSASEAAKVMKKRQVDKPIHKDNIQRILNKKQKMFTFMHEDRQKIH